MKPWLLMLCVPLFACEGDARPDEPDRLRGPREHGALMLSLSGLDLIEDPLSRDGVREGYAHGYINHPIDDTGAPEPSYLDIVLQFGAYPDFLFTPEPAWEQGFFMVHIRQSEQTPRGTRTLFESDVQPPVLRFEQLDRVGRDACQRDSECPAGSVCAGVCGTWRRYEGTGELEVFAADLKTGATWGRLKGTLHALDSADGPYTLETEFAAITSLECTWEVVSRGGIALSGTEYTGLPPEGRADECTAALAAIDAAEAHPDAPPVPPFVPTYWGTYRPPERWPGLDR